MIHKTTKKQHFTLAEGQVCPKCESPKHGPCLNGDRALPPNTVHAARVNAFGAGQPVREL